MRRVGITRMRRVIEFLGVKQSLPTIPRVKRAPIGDLPV